MLNIRIAPKGNRNILIPVIIDSAFTGAECDSIVQNALAQDNKKIENSSSEMNLISRPLDIFHPENQEFCEKIVNVVNEVNARVYNFSISHLYEVIYLEYRNSGFMDWHRDIGKRNSGGTTRKLTLSVLLSDSQDFEGGQLSFKPAFNHKPLQKGTVVIYPSYLLHSVSPVTSGLRRVIIASANGPHFR